MSTAVKLFALLTYNVYLVAAICVHATAEEESSTLSNLDWCNGLGFLIAITFLVYFYNLLSRVIIPGEQQRESSLKITN